MPPATYAFHNLAGGSYQLREVGQTGWRLVVPSNQFYNHHHQVRRQCDGQTLRNTQKALISGTVFKRRKDNQDQRTATKRA